MVISNVVFDRNIEWDITVGHKKLVYNQFEDRFLLKPKEGPDGKHCSSSLKTVSRQFKNLLNSHEPANCLQRYHLISNAVFINKMIKHENLRLKTEILPRIGEALLKMASTLTMPCSANMCTATLALKRIDPELLDAKNHALGTAIMTTSNPTIKKLLQLFAGMSNEMLETGKFLYSAKCVLNRALNPINEPDGKEILEASDYANWLHIALKLHSTAHLTLSVFNFFGKRRNHFCILFAHLKDHLKYHEVPPSFVKKFIDAVPTKQRRYETLCEITHSLMSEHSLGSFPSIFSEYFAVQDVFDQIDWLGNSEALYHARKLPIDEGDDEKEELAKEILKAPKSLMAQPSSLFNSDFPGNVGACAKLLRFVYTPNITKDVEEHMIKPLAEIVNSYVQINYADVLGHYALKGLCTKIAENDAAFVEQLLSVAGKAVSTSPIWRQLTVSCPETVKILDYMQTHPILAQGNPNGTTEEMRVHYRNQYQSILQKSLQPSEPRCVEIAGLVEVQ
jgi:hypothetical protein